MDKKIEWDEEFEGILEDDNIYSEHVRDQLLEDDELSPSEAGFMKGYDEAYV